MALGDRIKRLLIVFSLLFWLSVPAWCAGVQDALFDSKGDPRAYIAEDGTVYLWEGEPVAYLLGTDLYGLNGKHLGWFQDSILWDHDGRIAGCLKGAVSMYFQFLPTRDQDHNKSIPYKSYRQTAPIKPALFDKWTWARLPLAIFLGAGKD